MDLLNKYLNNNNYDYFPKTYQFNKNNIYKLKSLDFTNNTYILKPENDYSRGGITVIFKYNDIIKWINQHNRYNNWILQKYIINPLLIDNKKFHFRNYFLVIKRPYQDNIELYLFDKYFALFSSTIYDPYSKNLEGV